MPSLPFPVPCINLTWCSSAQEHRESRWPQPATILYNCQFLCSNKALNLWICTPNGLPMEAPWQYVTRLVCYLLVACWAVESLWRRSLSLISSLSISSSHRRSKQFNVEIHFQKRGIRSAPIHKNQVGLIGHSQGSFLFFFPVRQEVVHTTQDTQKVSSAGIRVS
jgi:hypothetical protein